MERSGEMTYEDTVLSSITKQETLKLTEAEREKEVQRVEEGEEDVRIGCPLGGDKDNCKECVYYPNYKWNKETGRCEVRR